MGGFINYEPYQYWRISLCNFRPDSVSYVKKPKNPNRCLRESGIRQCMIISVSPSVSRPTTGYAGGNAWGTLPGRTEAQLVSEPRHGRIIS